MEELTFEQCKEIINACKEQSIRIDEGDFRGVVVVTLTTIRDILRANVEKINE